MYEHILVALDGSVLAEEVVGHVGALAEKFGSRVTLLRALITPENYGLAMTGAPMMGQPIFPYPANDYSELVEDEKSVAEKYLQEMVGRLGGLSTQAQYVVREGPAADAILEYAGENDVSLIAMTTHGRGGLERMVIGSVTDDVLRRSNCPMLIVRVDPDRVAAGGE